MKGHGVLSFKHLEYAIDSGFLASKLLRRYDVSNESLVRSNVLTDCTIARSTLHRITARMPPMYLSGTRAEECGQSVSYLPEYGYFSLTPIHLKVVHSIGTLRHYQL